MTDNRPTDRRETEKTIIVLAIAYPPDPITGAARPGRFCRYLPSFGFRPVVIAARSAATPDPPPDIHRVPPERPGLSDRMIAFAGRLIQRLLPYNDSLPWSLLAARHGDGLCRSLRPAAVFSTSPPAGLHLAAFWLKFRYRIPWVADFRDPLLGNPFRTRRWLLPYDRWLENLIFRHADAIIANTDTLAEHWRARHPECSGKIHVIWNGFDPAHAIASEPLAPSARRVISHVGSLYGGRHPGRFLAALERLIASGRLDPATFLARLVGTVEQEVLQPCRPALEGLAARGCLDLQAQTVSPAEATRASATSDYLLLLDLNERGANLQVPAKLFEYVRLGRPVLAFTSHGSPVEKILDRSGIEFRAVYPDTPDDRLDEIVLDILALPSESRSPSDWFNTTFDGVEQTRRLAAILREVDGASAAPAAPPR